LHSLFENELSQTAVVSITSIGARNSFYSRALHLVARSARKAPTPLPTTALLASSGAAKA
jgi:hypothetical protein